MIGRKARLTVTIARQTGSGGSFIGRMIAERLNLRYVDSEVLQRAAAEFGVEAAIVAAREERISPLFDRLFGVFSYGQPEGPYTPPLPVRRISDKQLFDKETEIMKAIANEGDCVIMGRGGVHVLKRHPGMINIRCVAPMRARVERMMHVFNMTKEEACTLIQESDQMRKRCFAKMTGFDWTCSDNYHMSIDTSLMPLEETADMIINIIRHKMESL